MKKINTLRNGLPFLPWPEKSRKPLYGPSLDTLYEHADAELNSDKTVHNEFHRLRARFTDFRKSFIKFIRPKVVAINTRVILGIYDEDITTVCNRIYDDWMAQHDAN